MFDIIIPTYNNLQELKQCLAGFENQTFKPFTVHVCVDGSTDGTIEFLQSSKFPFDLKYYTHPNNRNRGRSATRNLPLDFLRREFLLLLDSDIIPEPALLENHYSLLSTRDCVSAGSLQYLNSETSDFALYLSTRGKNRYPHGAELPPAMFTSGNIAMRTDYYRVLGGQDPELERIYGGADTDFGLKLAQTFKVPLINNTHAGASTIYQKSLSVALKQYYEYGKINLPVLLARYPEASIFGSKNAADMKLFKIALKFLNFFKVPLLIRFLLKILPKKLRPANIHFLVFNAIYSGYWSAKK